MKILSSIFGLMVLFSICSYGDEVYTTVVGESAPVVRETTYYSNEPYLCSYHRVYHHDACSYHHHDYGYHTYYSYPRRSVRYAPGYYSDGYYHEPYETHTRTVTQDTVAQEETVL